MERHSAWMFCWIFIPLDTGFEVLCETALAELRTTAAMASSLKALLVVGSDDMAASREALDLIAVQPPEEDKSVK